VADDVATAVVWPAITFRPAAVRAAAAVSGAAVSPAAAGSADTDDWADAQPVTSDGGAGDDGEGPPPDALEAQMRGETAARNAAFSPRKKASVAREDETAVAAGPMPELDVLLARVPAEVKATLDELFRVRFQGVRRLPEKALINAQTKPAAS